MAAKGERLVATRQELSCGTVAVSYSAIVWASEYVARWSYNPLVDMMGKARLSSDAVRVFDNMKVWMVLLFVLIAYVGAYYRRGHRFRETQAGLDTYIDVAVWWAISAGVLYAFGVSLRTYMSVWAVVIVGVVCAGRLFGKVMEESGWRWTTGSFLVRWRAVVLDVYSKVLSGPTAVFMGTAMVFYVIAAVVLATGNEHGAEEAAIWGYCHWGIGVSIGLWETWCKGSGRLKPEESGQE